MKRKAVEFAERLDAVKAETEPPWWGWYPYKILPEFIYGFDTLLTGENRRLLEDPTDDRIADIGAADGDLAFFLETMVSRSTSSRVVPRRSGNRACSRHDC